MGKYFRIKSKFIPTNSRHWNTKANEYTFGKGRSSTFVQCQQICQGFVDCNCFTWSDDKCYIYNNVPTFDYSFAPDKADAISMARECKGKVGKSSSESFSTHFLLVEDGFVGCFESWPSQFLGKVGWSGEHMMHKTACIESCRAVDSAVFAIFNSGTKECGCADSGSKSDLNEKQGPLQCTNVELNWVISKNCCPMLTCELLNQVWDINIFPAAASCGELYYQKQVYVPNVLKVKNMMQWNDFKVKSINTKSM